MHVDNSITTVLTKFAEFNLYIWLYLKLIQPDICNLTKFNLTGADFY